MNRIDEFFREIRAVGRTAFMPFLTAGDPDLRATVELARRIAAAAAERQVPLLLEIGFPYSDPIADGPIIQESYHRALTGGVRIRDILQAFRAWRAESDVPLVAMISHSLVVRFGIEAFLDEAHANGFDGAIVPDLPFDEAGELHGHAASRDFKVIHLIAPTTPDARAAQIAQSATGFVYYVSVTGITGERQVLPIGLADRLRWLRAQTSLPICIGFGISRPEHVAQLRGLADGVIVGSAIVRRLKEISGRDDPKMQDVVDFVSSLMAPLGAATPPHAGRPASP